MDRRDLIRKLSDLQKQKDDHLKKFNKYLEGLAKSNSNQVFLVAGSCDECESYDNQINEIIKELNGNA